MMELTLAVVGIDYPNKDRSNRRMELLYCRPGDRVELRLEPKNKHDRNAVAVFSERNIQVGYITAERAPFIGGKIRSGEPCRAMFQDLDVTAAYIRVRFGGDAPTMPATRANHFADAEGYVSSDPASGFYADPEAGQWGA